MPAQTIRLTARFPGIRRSFLAALRVFGAWKGRRRPPDAASLSAHLRRDVGLPPEIRGPSTDPPPGIF